MTRSSSSALLARTLPFVIVLVAILQPASADPRPAGSSSGRPKVAAIITEFTYRSHATDHPMS